MYAKMIDVRDVRGGNSAGQLGGFRWFHHMKTHVQTRQGNTGEPTSTPFTSKKLTGQEMIDSTRELPAQKLIFSSKVWSLLIDTENSRPSRSRSVIRGGPRY